MTVQPATFAQLCDAVRSATALAIRGAATKLRQSPPPQGVTGGEDVTILDVSALRGIVEYQADECVITALAGTPLCDLRDALAAHGQHLPFDPPLVDGGATIGGTVAMGLSGSGRLRWGGVRDFVIGARVVDGEGRLIRSGGKVVKNAAGFLLHHAVVGSAGRFGVIAELTLKVFPAPRAQATVAIESRSLEEARAHARALRQFDVDAIDIDESHTTYARLGGRAECLGARVHRVQHLIGGARLPEDAAAAVWTATRELTWAPGGCAVIRTSAAASLPITVPTRYTCAGDLAWSAVRDVAALDRALASCGRRALVVRGRDAGAIVGRASTNPFEDRVRRALDPHERFRAASPAH